MYKICKTEESNARQRAIEQALLEAMCREPYGKITMSRLCGDLGIPRKTMYRYFPTKQDILLGLIDHRFSDCNRVVFDGWTGTRPFDKESLERFFSFWMGQARFLDAMIGGGFWPLLLERTTVIVDTMKETSTEPKSRNFARDQVDYFIAHGLMSTVLRWHFQGHPSAPGEMAEEFARILCAPELSITRLFL